MTFDISRITLPTNPGIYLMKDSEGVIIYIGKAKNLKKTCQVLFFKKPKLQDTKTGRKYL